MESFIACYCISYQNVNNLQIGKSSKRLKSTNEGYVCIPVHSNPTPVTLSKLCTCVIPVIVLGNRKGWKTGLHVSAELHFLRVREETSFIPG